MTARDLPVWHRLDLDAWINEPPSDSESEDEKPKAIFHDEEQRQARHRHPEVDEEELARVSGCCSFAASQGPHWGCAVGFVSCCPPRSHCHMGSLAPSPLRTLLLWPHANTCGAVTGSRGSCPQQRREARKQEQANNPFYIKSSPSPQKVSCPMCWGQYRKPPQPGPPVRS